MAYGGRGRRFASRIATGKGGEELFRTRRVRESWLPASGPDASLVSENRNLYMDNLRLWDCLALVRSDATMTCQSAIDLVFSLRDEEYLRSFPDTRHLMYLKFPTGVISHTNSEEANLENIRLKDENARLHAAVWVLRDNSNLQADTTVAAVFRLDDSQFRSKFPVDYDSSGLRSSRGRSSETTDYENNNRTRRNSFKSTLDVGGPDLAIRLTNRPLNVRTSSRRCRSMSAKRHQRAFYTMLPSRQLSFARLCGCDSTCNCNWKPPVCWEVEHVLDLLGEGKSKHGRTPKKEQDPPSHVFSPRPPCGAPGQRWQRVQCRQAPSVQPEGDQVQKETLAARGRHLSLTRESKRPANVPKPKRSNTMSGMDTAKIEKEKDKLSRAEPIKCVSFLEPLPFYKNDTPIDVEKEELKMSLDSPSYRKWSKDVRPTLYSAMTKCRRLDSNRDGRKKSVAGESKDKEPLSSLSRDSLAQANETNKNKSLSSTNLDHQHDLEKTRVLEIISGETDEVDANCSTSFPNPVLLNRSANNDGEMDEKPEAKQIKQNLRINRPLSANSRAFLSARLRNVNSLLRWKDKRKSSIRGSFNFEGAEENPRKSNESKSRVAQVSSFVDTTHTPESDRSKISKFLPDKSGFPPNLESLSRKSSVLSKTPQIFLSSEPAPPSTQAVQPYPLKSYPTPKHFLDRQRRLMGFHFFQKGTTFFTREITPSVESLLHNDYVRWKRHRQSIIEEIETPKPCPRHSRRNSYHKKVMKKHREPWPSAHCPEIFSEFKFASTDSSYHPPKAPGSLKGCETESNCTKEKEIKQLRKMGNFKYTQPLVDMLKRKSCDRWIPPPKGCHCSAVKKVTLPNNKA